MVLYTAALGAWKCEGFAGWGAPSVPPARKAGGRGAFAGGAPAPGAWEKSPPPFDLRALRPHDRSLAREMMRAGGFGLLHQRRDRAPGVAGLFRIDAVEPEHHRGVEHAAGIVADLEARAGPGREIAVAGAIDENVGPHRLPPCLALDHKRVDSARIMHHRAGAERMEENVDLVAQHE